MAYHSEKKIQKKIEHEQAALLDKTEIQSNINNINRRLAELDGLREHVQEHGTVYSTDPDARMMQMNDKGCDICHNVQIAVDEKAQIVVAVDVTSDPVDKEQLHSMSLQLKKNCSGYHHRHC